MEATLIGHTTLDAMPRTGAYLRRIHVFVGYQNAMDSIIGDHDLAWWVVVNFVDGLLLEEGMSVRAWDLIEDLDNTLHGMFPHWDKFRTANGE